MITIKKDPGRNIIITTAKEKLDQHDYDRLLPVVNEIIDKHGNIRWFFEMEDFDGWKAEALWRLNLPEYVSPATHQLHNQLSSRS